MTIANPIRRLKVMPSTRTADFLRDGPEGAYHVNASNRKAAPTRLSKIIDVNYMEETNKRTDKAVLTTREEDGREGRVVVPGYRRYWPL